MKKPKKKKTGCKTGNNSAPDPVDCRLPADYRERVISALKYSAPIAAASLAVPLKITLNERKISVSSFLCSWRYEKTERGFRTGIFPSDMTAQDAVALARALRDFYECAKRE